MRPHHRLAVCLVVLATLIGLAVLAAHASGSEFPTPSQNPVKAPRNDSVANGHDLPSTTPTTAFETYPEWQARLAAEAAAVAALNAAEAQRLADQLQAAINRSLAKVPAPQAAPVATEPANAGCDDPVIAGIITATFGASAPHALAVAQKESGCNPCGFYPSQHDCSAMPITAAGLFQLLGHQDLLDGVCPGVDHSWANPWCNTQAAWQLSSGGTNWGPWAASGG